MRCTFCLLFPHWEFISPCEAVLRKLHFYNPGKLIKTRPIIRCTHGKSNATINSSCFPPLFEKCVQEPLNSVKLLPWVGREKAFSQRMTPGFHSMSLHLSWLCCTVQAQLTKMSFFVELHKLLLLMLFFVMLRNNLVVFRVVLSKTCVHAFSSANSLAVFGNTFYIHLQE